LDEIVINEEMDILQKTPKVDQVLQESKKSSKRKRDTPVSARSTRSKIIETPKSTRSTRATVVKDDLKDFFQDEENEENEENVFEELVIQDEVEQDTTWFTRIWNGVKTTVFFM
jgi:CRISPR/Cas system-associated protein Cas5 (RAMP superfamily)